VRGRLFFLLLTVVIVGDVEKGFFGGGGSRKRVERGESTWATLVGKRDGGAGCNVGHSERETAEGDIRKTGDFTYHISLPPVHRAPSRGLPVVCPRDILTSCPLLPAPSLHPCLLNPSDTTPHCSSPHSP